jgi:ankyrin repeat protein
MDEEFSKALVTSIKNEFPDAIINYIYQQLYTNSNFDINTLWLHFYHSSNLTHVKTFVKLGANINYQLPDTGSTPLMYASQDCVNTLVKYLLENGADITIKNSSDYDVYYFANKDISKIIDEFVGKTEKEELVKKNTELEQQCNEMNSKLNYLLGVFEKMDIAGAVDLTHKRTKTVGE